MHINTIDGNILASIRTPVLFFDGILSQVASLLSPPCDKDRPISRVYFMSQFNRQKKTRALEQCISVEGLFE
jgi:hypothetical protein